MNGNSRNLLQLIHFSLLVSGILMPAGLPAQGSDSLTLLCTGTGSKMKTQTTFVNTYNRDKKKFDYATARTTGRKEFSGSAYVEISGATARIKLPNAMVPPLNSANNGWFAINGFFANDREFTGEIKINGLNKPDMRIDRNSGLITIEGGLSDFSGSCDLYDGSGDNRRF